MKISNIKTMTDPSLVDVVLALDIDGGVAQSPTLRLVTLASILELIGNEGDPISQAVIDAINAQIATLNTEYSTLNTSVQNNTTSLNALLSANFGTQINQLNASISALSTAYSAYVSANNIIVNQTSSDLTTLTNTVSTNIASNNSRLDNLDMLEANLQSNLNSLTSSFNALVFRVNGLEQTLNYVNTSNADQSVQISNLQTQVTALQNLLPCEFQHWHDTSKILTGGALASVQVAASFYATMWQQNPAAINDSFSFTVLLAAGTYTLVILMTRATNKGKLQLKINNVLAFNDVDGYNATTIYERVTRTITITTGGLQEFVFTVYTKNASSSAYFNLINKISAYKN